MRFWFSILLTLMLSLTAQAQERRLALLIGNEDYPAVVGRLSLPHQDVSTLDRTLRDLGFDVTAARDLDEDGMDDALSNFERQINSAAGRGEDVVAFLYYSGHGASAVMDGERVNYLLPAKETITTASELARKGIELDEVIRGLSLTSAKAVFVVTDACRNDLVSAFDRSGNKGFAPARARAGMFIAHSTYPGAVAPDDGAFAQTLARYLKEPGIEAARAFQLTNREVARGRGVAQIPTTANALIEDFYFTGRTAPPAPRPLLATDEGTALAQAISANTLAAYEAFRDRFPNSANLSFVNSKITDLSQSSPDNTPEMLTEWDEYMLDSNTVTEITPQLEDNYQTDMPVDSTDEISRDRESYELVTTARPNEAGPLFAIAKKRLIAFDYPGAEEAFKTFAAQFPDDPKAGEAHYWLAEVLYQQSTYVDSIQAYFAMIRNYPDDPRAPDAYAKLARSSRLAGDLDQACSVLELLTLRYPNAPAVTRNLAEGEWVRSGCRD